MIEIFLTLVIAVSIGKLILLYLNKRPVNHATTFPQSIIEQWSKDNKQEATNPKGAKDV